MISPCAWHSEKHTSSVRRSNNSLTPASTPSRSRGPPLRAVRRARVASSEASAFYSSRTCRTKLKRTSSENSVKSLAGWRISSCRIRTPSPSSSFWRLPKPGVRSRGSPTSVTVTYLSTSSGLRKIFSIQARRRSTSRAPRRWPSPTRRAVVAGLAGEVPGSYMPAAANSDPLAIGGNHSACCSGVPNSAMGMAAITSVLIRGTGEP